VEWDEVVMHRVAIFLLYLQHLQPAVWRHLCLSTTQRETLHHLVSRLRIPPPAASTPTIRSDAQLRLSSALHSALAQRYSHKFTLQSNFHGFAMEHSPVSASGLTVASQRVPQVFTSLLPMDVAIWDTEAQPRRLVALVEIDGPHHYRGARYMDYSNMMSTAEGSRAKPVQRLRRIDQLKERLYGVKFPFVPVYRVDSRDLDFDTTLLTMVGEEMESRESNWTGEAEATQTMDDELQSLSLSRWRSIEKEEQTQRAAQRLVKRMQDDGIL
jgi:hypothetical protein